MTSIGAATFGRWGGVPQAAMGLSGACAYSTWSGINRTQVEVGTRSRRQLPEVKTIQVHDFRPGRHEIVQELLLRI